MSRERRRRERRRVLRTMSITLVVLPLVLSVAGGAARAYWTAGSVTGGNGASAVATVNPGPIPTASAVGNAVTVSWAATTLTTGQAVTGYQIKRYDAGTLALQTILSACSGTTSATSCVESGVPTGSWKYTVTPVFATNWRGAESARSITVANPPTAVADAYSVNEDGVLTQPAAGVLTNDSGTSLTAVLVSGVANGSLTLNADGSFIYTPHLNFNGTDSFSYRAASGALTSIATTVMLTVAAVNDAPEGTPATRTTNENSTYVVLATDFGFTDPNDTPANTLLAVNVVSLPVDGSLKLGGIFVVAGQIVTAAKISSGLLKFTPANNANGAGYASFTFQVQDDGGTSVGGVDVDVSPRTLTLDVTAVNDPPSGTNKTLTALEDGSITLLSTNFGFKDLTDFGANTLLAVKMTTVVTSGSLELNGSAVTAGQFIPVADIDAGLLEFTPASDANGSPYASFTFQVQDNGGTDNGGIDLDASTNKLTFNVTAVNDPPAGTPQTLITNQDTAYTFTATDFGFTDPNDFPAHTFASVKITTLPAAGSLTLGGAPIAVGQIVTVAKINSGLLVFTPVANAHATPYTSFTFQVQDSGPTSNGGLNLDPSPKLLTLNVADNVAPSVTLTTPTDGTVGNNATPSFTGVAGDAAGDDAIVVVKIYAGVGTTGSVVQNINVTRSGAVWSTTAGALAGGTYTAQATQRDTSLNIGASTANVFIVDRTAPTVTGVSSTQPNGAYNAGVVIQVTVTFSEPVTVTGMPRLTLSTGSPANTAVDYTSGSGTGMLTFKYTVGAGNVSSDLAYAATTSLALNNGTIRDPATNSATLTLANPGSAGSLNANKDLVIDTTAPFATDSNPTNGSGGTVGRLDELDTLTLVYSEAILPASIIGSWDGATPQNIVVRVADGGVSNDSLTFYDATNVALLPLGTVNLGRGDYVTAAATFGRTGSPSTLTRNGSILFVTFGTKGGVTTTAAGGGNMVWTPAVGATDVAGNPASTKPVAETIGDVDF